MRDMVGLHLSVNETWEKLSALGKLKVAVEVEGGLLRSVGFLLLGKGKRCSPREENADTPRGPQGTGWVPGEWGRHPATVGMTPLASGQGPQEREHTAGTSQRRSKLTLRPKRPTYSEPHLPTSRASVRTKGKESDLWKVSRAPKLITFQIQEETFS